MAKYKLKSLSVGMGGKVYRKEDGVVFDTEKNFKHLKAEVEAAAKVGFFEKIKDDDKDKKAELKAAEEAKKAAEEAAKNKNKNKGKK